jgi:hypothetical protein
MKKNSCYIYWSLIKHFLFDDIDNSIYINFHVEYESLKTKTEDLLWYERDDELDLDFDTAPNQECSHDESTSETLIIDDNYSDSNQKEFTQSASRKEKKKRKKSFSGEFVYPLDLWYILSKFIRPEEILRFSLICKGAFEAVSLFAFWLRMYKIYVAEPERLPENLRPNRIDCRPGFRARVVRALFHQYCGLKSRLLTIVGNSSCIDALFFYYCSSMWFRQTKTKKDTKIWMFYFKLSQKPNGLDTKPRRFSKKWFNTVDFVRDNPDEGFTVLAASCLNFISFRPVLGMVLTEALVGVSQSMKHCRVKLTFHSHRKDKRYRPESGYQVILDPVQDIRVLNWWHPLYPTNG